MKALPKTLNLGINNFGGGHHVYAKNIERHGDFATVARICGDYKNGTEILICPWTEFNKPEYIKQIKDFILSVNSKAVFGHDQKNGAFVDVDALLSIIDKEYNLWSYDYEIIKKNPEKLHGLYLEVKEQGQKIHSLPRHHEYDAYHSEYPLIQVFSGLNNLIYG